MKAKLVTGCGCSRVIDLGERTEPQALLRIPFAGPGPMALSPSDCLDFVEAWHARHPPREFAFVRMVDTSELGESDVALYTEVLA